MYAPTTLTAAVALLFLTMFCWGSWANTFNLCRGKYRFELFYWDYAAGVLLGTVALAAVLGFDSDMFDGRMAAGNAGWAILSGVVFNIGNVLLVAAISLTGLAVAFPVCIGLALIIGVGVSWYIEPTIPAVPMAIGGTLILASMAFDSAAYRALAQQSKSSLRGIVIAVIGGIFMGAFPPCGQKATVGVGALDPYASAVMLAVGVVLCTLATNYFFMRWPIAGGSSVRCSEYFTAAGRYHLLGLTGGAVWAAGIVLYSIASDKVGAAVGYAFGSGGTLVAALWGIFVWKEFRGAPRRCWWYMAAMFVAFLAGIAVIGYAKNQVP